MTVGPESPSDASTARLGVSSRLVLASASPRRQSLLKEAGYDFEIIPADIDESDYEPGLMPGEVVELLAARKAQAVSAQRPRDVVLAADTVVAFGDTILGKPRDAADARRMLELLGGTTHLVVTGIAVARAWDSRLQSRRVFSAVQMRPLSDDELERYVLGREWEGKAGGYGIQDPDPFVTRVSGCQTNIVGLPMTDARELLLGMGILPVSLDNP